MPSIGTQLAQNPTRCFVVTQNENVDNNGAYYFSQANVDDWLAANGSKIQRLGKSVLVIPGMSSGSTLVDVVTGQNGATALDSDGVIQQRKTLIDMGKEIVIGNGFETRALVLRYVKSYADIDTGADAVFAYVPVENNISEVAPNNWGRWTVRVARI